MAGINVDMEHVIVDSQEMEKEEEVKPQKTKRVASLDIFRGLTVALMVLVDDAGGEWPMIGHAPWNGCNLADFVMPFFLFIVGMAIALALKRIPEKLAAIRKVILRTLKLLFWGLLLQGGYFHDLDKLKYGVDMNRIRLCGILQRIAIAYLVVAVIEITTRQAQSKELPTGWFSIFKLYSWQWVIGACVLVVYLATLYGTYVPDWNFVVQNPDSVHFGKTLAVTCNVRGILILLAMQWVILIDGYLESITCIHVRLGRDPRHALKILHMRDLSRMMLHHGVGLLLNLKEF